MTIEVKNISKSFNKNNILSDISVTFESGKIYGLVGRNGSGKSVFLKLICGFYVPTKGEILYDGINLNNRNEFPDNLRALIEKPSFFPDLTGYQNLKLLAKIQNKISDKEIEEALKIVNLYDEKDHLIGASLFEINATAGSYGVGAYVRSLFDKPVAHISQWIAIKYMKSIGIRWYYVGRRSYPKDRPVPTEKEVSIGHFKEGFATNFYISCSIEVKPSAELGGGTH